MELWCARGLATEITINSLCGRRRTLNGRTHSGTFLHHEVVEVLLVVFVDGGRVEYDGKNDE